MPKLSKANRQIMAEFLFKECQELGVELKVTGNWVEMTPAAKVPARLIQDAIQCGDELAALVTTKPSTKSGGEG